MSSSCTLTLLYNLLFSGMTGFKILHSRALKKAGICLVAILFPLFASQARASDQRPQCDGRPRTSLEGSGTPAVRTLVAAAPRFSELRSEIIGRVQKGELPSLSVGVIKDGRILWEEAIGWADKENRIVATPCTPYGLASLGKSVTATALMVLVERGKVDLDAPISRYLRTPLRVLEGNPDQVTVRRVLNMTAAIPHGYASFQNEEEMRRYSKDLVKNRGIVVFPPGEVYLYSNFSYAILEEVIERVSGKSYPEFLATEVFGPLGMANSFVGMTNVAGAIVPAQRYGSDGSRLPSRYALPQSSLATYSNVDALLNYAMFHIRAQQFKERQIFGDKLLDKMHLLRGEAPHSLLALGFGSSDFEKRLSLLTNGRAGGIQATLEMIPSEGLAVVCLVNSSGQATDDLAFRITDALVPGFLAHMRRSIGDFVEWANQPYQPMKELLGEWKGTISTSNGQVPLKLLFQPDGDIHVLVGRQPETILSDVGYREGLLSGSFLANIPMEEGAGHPHLVSFALRMKGDHFSGFVTSDFTNEKGTFSLPAYVRLSRP